MEGDAQALPFPDETFDAVCANFGILHLARPEVFLREAHRVLKPGGRVAFTVWIPTSPGMTLVTKSLADHGDANVPLPEGPPFFKYADAEAAAGAMTAAGFDPATCATDAVPLTFALSAAEDLYDLFAEARGGAS